MYSYYYPSYFTPTKTGTPGGMTMPQEGEVPMTGPGVPGTTSGMPVIPAAPPVPTIPPVTGVGEDQGPPVTTDIGYTQAYLKTQIGKRVRVEFLIGTNTLTDRTGILVDVGISYIIIKPVGTDDLMLCDIYSIKFVTFLA